MKGSISIHQPTYDKIKSFLKSNKQKNEDVYEGCDPPLSCFTCPLPECNNNKLVTKKETEFTKRGLEKDYIVSDVKINQHTINLPYCPKSNLLM